MSTTTMFQVLVVGGLLSSCTDSAASRDVVQAAANRQAGGGNTGGTSEALSDFQRLSKTPVIDSGVNEFDRRFRSHILNARTSAEQAAVNAAHAADALGMETTLQSLMRSLMEQEETLKRPGVNPQIRGRIEKNLAYKDDMQLLREVADFQNASALLTLKIDWFQRALPLPMYMPGSSADAVQAAMRPILSAGSRALAVLVNITNDPNPAARRSFIRTSTEQLNAGIRRMNAIHDCIQAGCTITTRDGQGRKGREAFPTIVQDLLANEFKVDPKTKLLSDVTRSAAFNQETLRLENEALKLSPNLKRRSAL